MITWDCSDAGLNPTFRDDIQQLLTSSPYDWHVVYGYRTIQQQEVLYEKYENGGNKAAPPGYSAHNFGLAVDLQLIVNGNKQDWDTGHAGWQWLFAAVKASPSLHSGVTFGDADHVERYMWKAFKNWATPTPVAAAAA